MRDFFEPNSGKEAADPTESARRSARTPLRSRFFETVATNPVPDGFTVTLDGKPIRTPAQQLLVVPRHAIAEALRDEWDSQTRTVDPGRMPLTRLVNSIIDGVAQRRDEVTASIVEYVGSDLLFYRADSPEGLVARQGEAWDPIVRWAATDLGARFALAAGIVHVSQSEQALAAAGAAIPADPWIVGALHSITTLTGSALLAIALLCKFRDDDAIWRAAHVDEDWNFETWGIDDLAIARRAGREAEFRAAALVLAAMD